MSNSTTIVDVVAPASACSNDRLEVGLETLRDWGLQPRLPAELFGTPGITAHRDDRRLQALSAALRAPDSRLVWCVRGGYGSLRLLTAVARRSVPRRDKIVLGFSDISSLQMMLHERFGMAALHAPVVAQLGTGDIDATSLRAVRRASLALASGAGHGVEFTGLTPMNDAARRPRQVTGVIKGTNLETVRSLVGTPWQPDGRGTIWCFEEVNERGYQVDRVLTQFALAGVFDRSRAVVFGRFSGGAERDGRSTLPGVLRDFAASVRFPVLDGLAIGHGPRNLPLPLGVPGRLTLGDSGVLAATCSGVGPT